jgi:23S rRNA (adenine2503-C2)-methyltransferase
MKQLGPFGLTVDQLKEWCSHRGQPAYRGQQVAVWLYSRREVRYDHMTDLPIAVRTSWQSEHPISLPEIDLARKSRDGTEKLRVRMADGEAVETVIMPMRAAEGEKAERITACLSTQVGCALGCTFCATATLGLRRNLEAGEIVAQLLLAQQRIAPRRLTNVVFMGMGEPLHNLDAVSQAVRVMSGQPGMDLGARRITVSTVGLVPEIYQLADSGLGVKLAISLNATTDSDRSHTMPVNRRYPLRELMDAAKYYARAIDNRVTFEYVVLAGVNDREEDARRLAKLVHGVPCKINLIPYNPSPLMSFVRPAADRLIYFRDLLYPSCPAVTIRFSKGLDIDAACGQLVAGRPVSEATKKKRKSAIR